MRPGVVHDATPCALGFEMRYGAKEAAVTVKEAAGWA